MDEIQVEIYGEPKSKAGNSKINANGKRTLTDAVVNSNARNQWEKMLIAKGDVSLHLKSQNCWNFYHHVIPYRYYLK
jgi:hypothetical protein